jgi:hypothetical protein
LTTGFLGVTTGGAAATAAMASASAQKIQIYFDFIRASHELGEQGNQVE